MTLNLKRCALLGTTILVTSMPLVVRADVDYSDLESISSIHMHANTDASEHQEYIEFWVAQQQQMVITPGGTTIQNALTVVGGTTSLLSNTIDIGTGENSTQVQIGSSESGTNVYLNGGADIDDKVRISSGSVVAFESVVEEWWEGETEEDYGLTNAVNITAALLEGVEDELADITLDAADDVNINTGDDLEVDAESDIQLEAGDDIELDAVDAIDLTAAHIRGYAGNATMAMLNGSITNSVANYTTTVMRDGSIANTVRGEGYAGGTVIASNGSARWIADANGSLVQIDSTNTTAGTTASMFVTNSEGKTHGLVVQETKTTLSGGRNSASMTLDDRGATFSNPANGAPIQVHGVADGTAPFDAVNVRQLYSGLAAVLASTPDIDLAPGRTGMAFGLGGYGGYSAIGLGFGHMYENGATVRASAAKASDSEVAYRASVSWSW
jgi:hypothetical protein